MKNRFVTFSLLLAVLIGLTSCGENVLKGEGKKTTVTPAVSAFNALDIDLSLKTVINVKEGSRPEIKIDGYENVVKHIKATIENNSLHIASDLDETWTMDSDDVTITVTMPSIVALSLSGSTDAETHGIIAGSAFKVEISGASNLKLDNVSVDNFALEVSGAGDIEVKGGTVKQATYEINGAGELKAFPLQSAETSASISGAGSSEVTALQKLTASINGAGSIKYKGHPTITQDVSGVGSISDAN